MMRFTKEELNKFFNAEQMVELPQEKLMVISIPITEDLDIPKPNTNFRIGAIILRCAFVTEEVVVGYTALK